MHEQFKKRFLSQKTYMFLLLDGSINKCHLEFSLFLFLNIGLDGLDSTQQLASKVNDELRPTDLIRIATLSFKLFPTESHSITMFELSVVHQIPFLTDKFFTITTFEHCLISLPHNHVFKISNVVLVLIYFATKGFMEHMVV